MKAIAKIKMNIQGQRERGRERWTERERERWTEREKDREREREGDRERERGMFIYT